MIVYIKDKKTFATKVMATAVDYEIHESIYDAVSKVTVPTPKVIPEEGDFLMFDGMPYVGIVSEVDIDGGTMEISAEQGVKMFAREMFYTSASYTYLEDYLKSLIDANYTNCTDAVYKTSFLSVSALSHTSGSLSPDLDTDGNTYSIMSYISKLRRLKDIVCEWSFNNTTLSLGITKKVFTTYNIDLSNPRYKLVEQTLSKLVVGKLSVFCTENNNTYTRYLKTDGTITSTYSTTDRVEGEWNTLVIDAVADLNDAVADEFAQNYYSHKISFITDEDFNLYDKLNIRMDGKVFKSYVSGIIKTKGSDKRTIECGELQTQYPFLERL